MIIRSSKQHQYLRHSGVASLLLVALGGTIAMHGCAAQSQDTSSQDDVQQPHLISDQSAPSFDFAYRLYANGQRPEALVQVNHCLKRTPDDAQLLALRGEIESYDCQFEQSTADFTRALAKAPSAELYARRGADYMHQQKFAAARSDIMEALKSPEDKDYEGLLEELNNLEYDYQHALKDPAKLWAIGCTSSLYVNRHNGNFTLAGAKPSPQLAKDQRETLSRFWRINNRQELLTTLRQLVHDYDNKHWQNMRKLPPLSPQVIDCRMRWGTQEDYNYALMLLKTKGDTYGERGILAWDYCRFMNVCRGGYQAGYLSEEQTWSLMLPMAARIQTLFKSWSQLEEEYLVGFSFWCRSAFAGQQIRYMARVNRLLKDPNSPWVKLPWNTKIGSKSDDATIYSAISRVAAAKGPGG